MSDTGTKVGVGLFVVILGFGLLVMMERGIQLGGREPESPALPPDPFENNEPRTVECRVEWKTKPERQVGADIYCQIGEQENNMESLAVLNSPWSWWTTGAPGDEVYLEMTPSRQTEGTCWVYVDGLELAKDEFADDEGCLIAEITLP